MVCGAGHPAASDRQLRTVFANLLQAAAARSRERLADASAVQFTRQPQGLANALKKIAAHPLQGRLYHRRARSVAHMVLGDSGASWFATHPPPGAG
ncbi:M48 family metalloprotease, partial [Pseudomonas sp. BAV 2493]|uniref:M48 family metalloprotease n=1 Tax=Pseudomonas sp. BAV 2493 TaxID=2654187 RepID=UPI00131AFB71